ncbi:DUF1624 domain-containing protein [Methylobacterium sp. Leaf399]|uniref:DUF1624 domain-containing protein n=1 Tax=Methylobacterium sp. Leaf399 TaxID=1736364 RepID=UPI000A4F6077
MLGAAAMQSAETTPPAAVPPGRRFAALDAARGAALVAMAAYHLAWDLGHLGLTPENYALTPPGKAAAHGIAGTFLFLVGIGLVLMRGRGEAATEAIRRRRFLMRLLRIGGAALAITAATRIAFPDSYIFFGILHCIALSSVLAVPFLRAPALVSALGAVAVLAAPHLVQAEVLPPVRVFDDPVLAFLGLGRGVPQTNDYVPLFPWFGLVLAGIAAARLAGPAAVRSSLPEWAATGRAMRGLAMAGRHSLSIYLVHQPVLLGLLTGVVALSGQHPRAGEAEFRRVYARNCTETGGEAGPCRIAARCVVVGFRREGLWAEAGRSFTPADRARAQALSQACYEAAASPP